MNERYIQESLESLILEAMYISRELGYKQGYEEGRRDLEKEIKLLNKFSTVSGFIKHMLGK